MHSYNNACGMDGKVALITGAATGLGKEFCRVLLNKGVRVCLADVDEVKGQETVRHFCDVFGKDSAFFIKCDVTNRDEFETAFATTKKRYGKIDIVCNNAGILHEGRWEQMLAVNMGGVIQGTKLALKYMAVNEGGKGGVIVNMSSLAGVIAIPYAPVYCATKHGVLGFTRAVAAEYRTHGVRANCLCPGATAGTDIFDTKPDQILCSLEELSRITKGARMQGVDVVGKAFLQLVEDETKNCVVLKVNPVGGISEKKYRDWQFLPGAKI